MNIKDLDFEEISDYIQAEREKGREMREIVRELARERDDVILLSHDLEISERQILESAERRKKSV